MHKQPKIIKILVFDRSLRYWQLAQMLVETLKVMGESSWIGHPLQVTFESRKNIESGLGPIKCIYVQWPKKCPIIFSIFSKLFPELLADFYQQICNLRLWMFSAFYRMELSWIDWNGRERVDARTIKQFLCWQLDTLQTDTLEANILIIPVSRLL